MFCSTTAGSEGYRSEAGEGGADDADVYFHAREPGCWAVALGNVVCGCDDIERSKASHGYETDATMTVSVTKTDCMSSEEETYKPPRAKTAIRPAF